MNIKDLINSVHKPELSEVHGMVYQVWEDGEVTLQKCGDLLWQRTLITTMFGDPGKAINANLFPCEHDGHGYAFTDREGAIAVHEAILSATLVDDAGGTEWVPE